MKALAVLVLVLLAGCDQNLSCDQLEKRLAQPYDNTDPRQAEVVNEWADSYAAKGC